MDFIPGIKSTLVQLKAEFDIIKTERPIKSRQDAEGYFKIETTVPCLIMNTNKGYYALIISGERQKLDFKQIQKELGFAKFDLAERKEVKNNLSLDPGRIPLIGHNLPTIIDNWIFKHEYVYGGTGDFNHTLKIKPKDLEKALNVEFKFD